MLAFTPQTGSTNADLLARLAFGEDIPEASWLVADRQTAGRGRQGRAWQDGFGNFMGSTLVHLRADDPPPQSLALLAGVALHRVVAAIPEAATAQIQLKWPNDLLLDGGKLAGILLERQTLALGSAGRSAGGSAGGQASAVVIGIGVNLAAAPALADRATATLGIAPSMAARNHFADALAQGFAKALGDWRAQGIGPLLADWQSRAHPPGSLLRVAQADGVVLEGQFAGLADDGALRLRLADGALRVMHAGEIALLREDGGKMG